MTWIIVAVVIVAVALFLLAKRSEKGKSIQETFLYQKSEALFTPAERSFLGVLKQAVGNNAAIFGKVRVADVVEPRASLGRGARQKAFNRISAKHFDFLLCDKEDLSVACAIELDDGSHNSKRRQERDEFLKEVCKSAGVPLIQVPAKSAYAISEVRSLLPRYLTVKDKSEPESLPEPIIEKHKTNGKLCPNCSTVMVKRVAKNGKHVGKQFWACKAYPKCKTMEAVSPSS
jgi:ssDNA-binding Zn-finger/Zn-ribbon topoisomerase 1